jgi:hypothetical protein
VAIKHSIILIPFWIQDILRRNNMDVKECIDFSKLRSVTSIDDLAQFAQLQRFRDVLLDINVGQAPVSFEDGKLLYGSLGELWHIHLGDTNHEAHQEIDSKILPLCDGIYSQLNETLIDRLFTEGSTSTQHSEPFALYELSESVLGVIINPGRFICDKKKNHNFFPSAHRKPLIAALLRVLYVYNTECEVNKTSLFKKYLELLVSDMPSST